MEVYYEKYNQASCEVLVNRFKMINFKGVERLPFLFTRNFKCV